MKEQTKILPHQEDYFVNYDIINQLSFVTKAMFLIFFRELKFAAVRFYLCIHRSGFFRSSPILGTFWIKSLDFNETITGQAPVCIHCHEDTCVVR